MIANTTITNQKKRSMSPYNFVAPNTKFQFKPLSDLLKSPNTQRNILNKTNIVRSPSTEKKSMVVQKENPDQQNNPRNTLAFRNSSSKKQQTSIQFTNFIDLKLKPMKNIENISIKPFQIPKTHETQQTGLRQQDFHKIKELGKGKFGNVWLVTHKETNFLCALKIIKKSVVREEKIEYQIAKQIRIHSQLKHQNIIAFYGYFANKENFYIVTQFAIQGHVYSRLKTDHRLQEKQVKAITRQTVDGLRIMHNMGYIHRDIKPQNILLHFDVVKICDFGWAAECRGNQMRKSQCGTPLYYSPQIVKKEEHNTQIDVWSIGLLTYEMIVGRVPFSIWSEFDLKIILEHQVCVPDYVDCSQSLKDFIGKCLIKDQKERPLLNDLRQHSFINQAILRVQSIGGLYGEVKALF